MYLLMMNRWCFTVNRVPRGWAELQTQELKELVKAILLDCAGKPQDSVAEEFLKTITAAVWQVEKAPETGHLHLQGGVQGRL